MGRKEGKEKEGEKKEGRKGGGQVGGKKRGKGEGNREEIGLACLAYYSYLLICISLLI